MNARYRQVIIWMVVATFLFSSTQAYAWPRCGDSEEATERAQEKREKFIKGLGLTSEQEKEIKKIRKAQRKRKKDLIDKIQFRSSELRERLERPIADMEEINSVVTELKALMAEKLDQRVEGILSMKEVMTPEQYEKFRKHCKDKIWKKHKGMKKGWDRRGF